MYKTQHVLGRGWI